MCQSDNQHEEFCASSCSKFSAFTARYTEVRIFSSVYFPCKMEVRFTLTCVVF